MKVGLLAGLFALFASVATGVQWSPVAADGVTPINNVLRFEVAMAWTDDGAGGALSTVEQGAAVSQLAEQSPGSLSVVSAGAFFETEDTDGFQPANLLLRTTFSDPNKGTLAVAETAGTLTQIGVVGQFHAGTIPIGAPPGTEADESPWRFRLDPTGAEVIGEPVQIHAFASIDGAVGTGEDADAIARVLSSFSVNGQTILFDETISSDSTSTMPIDESGFVVLSAAIGDVIEVDFSIRNDAQVNGGAGLAAMAELTSLRFDIDLRPVRSIADLNNDGVIDTADLGLLIGAFGQQGTNFDLNADGVVDTADLGILLSVFGQDSI